jgi:hypothetical protein
MACSMPCRGTVSLPNFRLDAMIDEMAAITQWGSAVDLELETVDMSFLQRTGETASKELLSRNWSQYQEFSGDLTTRP